MWQPSWACPTEGCFYPPTLFTDVQPSSTIAQVEIFGPVLVTMTFRTPEESVALANNTPYGLAASVWTESINLALDIAPKIKAGVVWVNSTNLFDAAAGFGGYRESGFGREGGREGMWEYVKRAEGRGWRAERGARRSAPHRERRTVKCTHGATRRHDRSTRHHLPARSTARRSSSSAASRRAPIRVTRVAFSRRRARSSASRPKAIARTFETPSKPRTRRRRHGREPRDTTAAQILYYIAENLSARARGVRGAHRRDDRMRRPAREAGSRRVDLAAVHVRRVGRQVRRRGAQRADSRRRDRDERADRRHRHRVSR